MCSRSSPRRAPVRPALPARMGRGVELDGRLGHRVDHAGRAGAGGVWAHWSAFGCAGPCRWSWPLLGSPGRCPSRPRGLAGRLCRLRGHGRHGAASHGVGDPRRAVHLAALLLGPAVLAVASSVGVLAGFTLPSWATVAVAAPTFFVAGAVVPEWAEGLVRQGPVTGSLAGLAYAETTALATAAGAVSISALCVVWIAVRRPRLRAAATLGCLVPLAVSAALSATVAGERFEPGHERATVCGTGAGVVVCVAPSNTARLGPLTSAVATAVGTLRSRRGRCPSSDSTRWFPMPIPSRAAACCWASESPGRPITWFSSPRRVPSGWI